VGFELKTVPNARVLYDLQQGTIDGAFFLGKDVLARLPSYEAIPVPLLHIDYVAVTADSTLVIHSTADIVNLSVAYPLGYPTLDNVVKSLRESYATTTEYQAFKMLAAGHVKVVLCAREAVAIFSKAAEQPVFVQKPIISSAPLFLVVRSDLKTERAALLKVFAADVENGAWKRDFDAVGRSLAASSKP
jgi:hypothetical protein